MLNFAEDDPQNNLDDIRSFTEHLGDHLNPVPADASYFPFPPTFFCPESLHDLLLFPSSSAEAIINSTGTGVLAPPDGLQPAPVLHPPHGATPAMVAPTADVTSARTRASRKDRHSKIFTASGPRDRRMRLSIDVARKFFQLQDMLGFDKASKTVQWLLSMSKAAIKDLATGSSSKRNDNSTSSSNLSPNSESSTISGSKNYCNKNSSSTVTAAEAGEVHMAAATTTTKARKGSTAHKIASRRVEYFNSTLARDSRVKARERARERTKEKQRFTSLTSSNNSNHLDAIKEESTALPLQDLKSILDQFVERANCDYPSSGGTATIPVYGNISHQGDTAAVGGTTSSIYQEQWDLETISFYNYSRTYQLWPMKFAVKPNVCLCSIGRWCNKPHNRNENNIELPGPSLVVEAYKSNANSNSDPIP